MNWLLILKWLKNPYIIAGLVITILMVYCAFLRGSVTRHKLKLAIMEMNFKECTQANKTNITNIQKLKDSNAELADQWTEAKNGNAQAVELIKHAKRLHDEQIKDLKAQIKPIQACDNMLVSSDHIELLKQASNN